MLEALKKGGGYAEVSYLWRNPANSRLEQKNTLLRQVGRYAVAVGYYVRPET
jgi:cytochrome c